MCDKRELIEGIAVEEFANLLQNIEVDFSTNYTRKKYNFLLNQMDTGMVANMVFVSSFESKSGYAIETVEIELQGCDLGKKMYPQ